MNLELSHLPGAHTTPVTEHSTRPRRAQAESASRLWAALLALCLASSVTLLAVLISSPAAGAYATTALPPTFSSAPGLPDGRVYEEVSPPNKYSNQAGARAYRGADYFTVQALAGADGNGVFFGGDGPFGESASGIDNFFIAKRSSKGWSARSAVPRPPLLEGAPGHALLSILNDEPRLLTPSPDLSHSLFTTEVGFTPGPAHYGIGSEGNTYGWAYLAGSDPLAEPTWLTRPVAGGSVVAAPSLDVVPVGGTPDFSTVYFTDAGSVGLPEDAARANHLNQGSGTWGFYQYRNGALSEAGVLPDGSVNPYGAVPAALAGLIDGARITDPDQLDNEVSSNGLTAFFVSPDPRGSSVSHLTDGSGNPLSFCSDCTSEAPQLYVRKTAADGSQSTALVSRSQFPGHTGEKAPNGAARFPIRDIGASYVFGSPDGSQAFFASSDQLTQDAPSTTLVDLSDEGSAGGLFTLTAEVSGVKESTASLPYGASSAEVQSALEALGNVGPGHVTVSNGKVTFTGLEPAPVKLTASPQTFEYPLPAAANTFKLTVEVAGVSRTTTQIADGASAAEVQTALEALGNVGAGNVTVTAAPGGGSITFSESLHNEGLAVRGSEGTNLTPTSNPRVFTYMPSYTLTVTTGGLSRTTAPIAYAASVGQIASALDALSNVGAGNATATALSNGEQITFAASVAQGHLTLTGNGLEVDVVRVGTAEATPAKYYDFDVETETLTYLPSVSGSIVAAAPDGSSFLFENLQTSPAEMDRWSAGPGGGTVTPVAQLPGFARVEQARTSEDGSIDLFVTDAPIAGFNDGGTQQIFRYDATSNALNCVSCAPVGVTPERSVLSNTAEGPICEQNGNCNSMPLADDHSMSTNGDRVFFDTATPLVPQDTDGTTDVYEWENGTVFLISSGASSDQSWFMDNSADGGDVFFATTDALAPGDTEGAYDVYDARVPHPGDNPPPSALPCQGDVCQGPASVPSLLGEPSSETFNGLGNVVPEVKPAVAAKPKAKPKPKALSAKQKLAKALKACKKKSKGKRATCEARARKTYNGRGK
jgi:hypothetical protein